MTYTRNDEKFDAAMKSVEARRRKLEANGYAAGALVLANNNSSFKVGTQGPGARRYIFPAFT